MRWRPATLSTLTWLQHGALLSVATGPCANEVRAALCSLACPPKPRLWSNPGNITQLPSLWETPTTFPGEQRERGIYPVYPLVVFDTQLMQCGSINHLLAVPYQKLLSLWYCPRFVLAAPHAAATRRCQYWYNERAGRYESLHRRGSPWRCSLGMLYAMTRVISALVEPANQRSRPKRALVHFPAASGPSSIS